ncbi:MAG: CBS domain-containing protein [Proteobacteria bacterium]|nr:CBS domain-containing protein [Desulfobacteraceae bacterium]MBU2522316.1 CBS domain-containing protein [Pseudomonadota bacterium]MBU4013925.1 CBS domain-containing protein [Pseudomonadota bacterium]MBU4101101.1 CBS domain-containing protein [Pseudomonadota bacterium]MBU4127079.1 CBS domain-containing protein [Pseudomonadota bacterium]
MEKLTVKEITLLMDENLSNRPSVSVEDKITDAIEVMLKNNLDRIAVISKDKILGMIKLEDALKVIGLEDALKKKTAKIIIRHGRRIIIEQ